jgi:hypothetical protein
MWVHGSVWTALVEEYYRWNAGFGEFWLVRPGPITAKVEENWPRQRPSGDDQIRFRFRDREFGTPAHAVSAGV